MIKFRRYPRYSYWSLSQLANWLREKAGLTNPYALSGEGWAENIDQAKRLVDFFISANYAWSYVED